ncbi:MAG TPA: SDR family NAD(P)-dependent oxidoreductase [Afifellaceae bacterium]|nr:SDR family NAD(P)-dependent oxidoreductase [Afifellaceae bacterium]
MLEATGGRLDALFNNGGYAQPGAVEDLTSAALREQFDANFFGWHALTRRAIPVMRAQGAGRIVNNSSVLGLLALGFRAAYVATKFAMEGYTDALRIELEGTGIRVAAIEPGPIRSRMNDNAIAAFRRHIDIEGSVHSDYYRRRIKSLEEGGNRLGQLEPDAVLKALVHACESERPRPHYYVTNQTKLAAGIRRLLPDRALHKVVTRFTG